MVLSKQAPRAWFEKFRLALGFISTKSDQSLFVNITPYCFTHILVYVDDILLTRNCEHFIQQVVT